MCLFIREGNREQTVTGVIPMSPVTARAYFLKEEFPFLLDEEEYT